MITNAEFRMKGGDAGVLLIHGLTGTPTEMRWVGQGLNRAGFTVYGMQLAGHCGDEDDLLETRWQDWLQSVRNAVDQFRPTVRHLFVAGLSMGAVLALKIAIERPEEIDGLGIYGVNFSYDGWSIPAWARIGAYLLPLARPLHVGRHRRFLEQPPYGIKDDKLRKFIFERMAGGDSAAAGLIGNPWHSLADMYELSGIVRRQLPQVRVPCIVIHAANDDVASAKNARLVVERVSAPTELVLLENSYHMVTIDRERHIVFKRSTEFFKRIMDEAARAS